MSEQPSREPGSTLIFVHSDPEPRAYVARYEESGRGGVAIQIALNADDLEGEARTALAAQGWTQGEETAHRFEYACPPELSARAVFPDPPSAPPAPLQGYERFLASAALKDMPPPIPDPRLPPALALERVKTMPPGDWTRGGHPSDVILMHEYLRRAALWADTLGVPQAWPFFNVTAQALPDQVKPEDLFQQWKAHEYSTEGHFEFMAQWAVYCYLHWSTAAKRLTNRGLPAPYEPLIRLLERGGSLRKDAAGFVEAGGRVIGTWGMREAYAALPAWAWLDDGTLNWLDQTAG